mgnify:CR=1 FL=1
MDKFARLVAARGLGVEEGHVRRHEEVHAAGDEVEVYVLAPERLTVDVHDEILLAVDLEMTALEMGDEFFQLTVAALGVLADEPDELQARHVAHDEKLQLAVIGPGVGDGVEAAAVEPAVARADERRASAVVHAAAAHGQRLGDALEEVGHGGQHIAVVILVHLGADARVDADGADVDRVAPAALHHVERTHFAAHEIAQVEKAVLFLAEHFDEVVARAAGEVGHGDVIVPDGAVDALVERAVAAAGIYPQLLAGSGLGLDLRARIHGRGRDVDLIGVRAALEREARLLGHVFMPVLAAGDGVDDEQMFHSSIPALSTK